MRYAIGDIHGGLQTFTALLNKLHLRHHDRLYLLGDYVDRGNDSKGVLDAILRLKNAGYDVRPVRGNHDDMMLRTFTQDHDDYSWYWMKGWGVRTLESFQVGDMVEVQAIYVTLLDSLPYFYRDENYFLVHAGLDMTKDDPLTETEPAQMLWGDASLLDTGKELGDCILVTGHKIRSMQQIEASLATRHIQIDNGAYSGYDNLDPSIGCLVALDLDTMELTAQRWLDGEATE